MGRAYLNEVFLSPFSIHTSARRGTGRKAEQVKRAAERDIRDPHMLRAERDEVAHRGRVMPLDISTKKLSACA